MEHACTFSSVALVQCAVCCAQIFGAVAGLLEPGCEASLEGC